MRPLVPRDAEALVLHREPQMALLRLESNRDGTAPGRVLGCVLEQVSEDVTEPFGVSCDAWHDRRGDDLVLHVCARVHAQALDHVVRERERIDSALRHLQHVDAEPARGGARR